MNKRTYLQAAPSGMDQPERLVTDVELAARLSISRRHVHVLRSRGQLRAVRLGTPSGFRLMRIWRGCWAILPSRARGAPAFECRIRIDDQQFASKASHEIAVQRLPSVGNVTLRCSIRRLTIGIILATV